MSTFIQNVHIKDGEYTKTIYTMVDRVFYFSHFSLQK